MPPQQDPNAETLAGQSPPDSENKQTTSRANLIGTTLGGRYIIERELGRGGMGAVYLAHDKPELHSRPVVVKVLLEEAMKHEFVVSKFYQEIESLTRLDDPGVIGIFDAGRLDDGSPYLVMQYVEGTTLRAVMKHEGMDLQQAAGIIRQLGRSIAAAHNAGILHRDLKPENIMLRTTATGERQVKIIDFGIAKVKNSMSGPSPMTGHTVGTLGYMSPEQLSAKPLTPAGDIYSLGVIAYEMLTGRNPFNPDSVFQLLDMQREGVRVRPSDLRPSVSETAEQVILKALAFDPNERFQRAQDFGDQLSSCLASGYDTSERTTQEMPTRKSPAAAQNPSETVEAPPGQRVKTASQPTLETAHVLFMDVVGYSNLLIDEQTARLQELQEIVRNTQEFKNAQLTGQLLRSHTGDGMALSFFGDPESPVRCAVEVGKALREYPEIKLRMGVHSGFVYRLPDINANMNIAGGGINMAQRVMDCGDAGHIILSKRVADDLGQLGRWAEDLHDLGEAEVKHGVRLHVYNLYNDEIGNPERPAKLRPGRVPRRLSGRASIVAVAVVILALISAASYFLVKSALTPTRSLTYSLTVQRISGNQKDGDEFQSTGQEPFGNGWQYRMNVTAGQSGYLYMLNEGTVNYNVLFPTEPNNNHLETNQTMQTVRYFFDEHPGIERVWIVLSAQPLSELDAICKDAAKNVAPQKLTITDPAQLKTVRDTIARYSITEPVVDKSKKQSIIKGTGNVLVSLLELKHNQQ